MTQLRTIISGATRTPHLVARPAATVLAEYRPNPDSDLRGAACADSDTNLFYPDPEEMGPETAEWAERRAKMICAGCPVKAMCLSDAMERREPHGIFGGLNERERNSALRRAARSRARVNAGGAG
ncbi:MULTISPECIES: WhiB family transcriptional regulator [Streptomyces]|uniref:WhiB family transcriptional regulator n=1 Tax=Streptomyces TaxID=1883 RepID=UPI00099606EF|nr:MULTISPECIES: WhiB family transcriptional regulator [Streptomyces]